MASSSKNSKVYVNGYDITGYLRKATSNASAGTSDKSVFGNTSKSYIAHQKDADFVIEGLWDDTVVTGSDVVLQAILGASGSEWLWYPDLDTVGNTGYGFVTVGNKYDTTATLDDAVMVACGNQSTVGREMGKSLHTLAARSGSNYTGTAVNNGASSANGGSAYLNVTAVTGTIEVKIEHSSDNFAADTSDLVSFTAVSAIGSQRVTFTGTVKQYTRVYATIGGGESITFNALIHRI